MLTHPLHTDLNTPKTKKPCHDEVRNRVFVVRFQAFVFSKVF
jgi:hypothetical protein